MNQDYILINEAILARKKAQARTMIDNEDRKGQDRMAAILERELKELLNG